MGAGDLVGRGDGVGGGEDAGTEGRELEGLFGDDSLEGWLVG